MQLCFNLVRQVSTERQVSRLASVLHNDILVLAGYSLCHLMDLKQRPFPPLHKHCKRNINTSVVVPGRAGSSPEHHLQSFSHCFLESPVPGPGWCVAAVAARRLRKAVTVRRARQAGSSASSCSEERGNRSNHFRRLCAFSFPRREAAAGFPPWHRQVKLLLSPGSGSAGLLSVGSTAHLVELAAGPWEACVFVRGRDGPGTASGKRCCSREHRKGQTEV